MKVKIRKLNSNHRGSNNLLEWQPMNSRNNRWYIIHRDKISFDIKVPFQERSLLTRQLFNSIYAGLVAKVEAGYSRQFKILTVKL